MNDIKMIIVMRNDLNMRKGKMAAQAAHCASAFLIDKLERNVPFNAIERQWIQTGAKKICVRVDSEDDLIKVYNEAIDAGLRAYLITDMGLTEFNGPTKICIGIGPDYANKIDPITLNLKLL